MERSEEFVKKSMSETEGHRRGRPVVSWKDKVKDERDVDRGGGIEQAKR